MIDVGRELKKARQGRYAIGAFNTADLEVTKAICAGAKETDATILIQTTPSAIEYAGLQSLFDIVRDEIENSGVKAAIHLDHAKDFRIIKAAIEIGYRSVMFDGSDLDFEENINLTHKVVRFAHSQRVSVEAEVGVISTDEGSGIHSKKAVYSDPKEVLDFVQQTGVDSVAVSIGNEHGGPRGEKLNIDLLKKIAEIVEIPIVIHGSSGLSESDIHEAILAGAAKFNIDTNIKRAFTKGIRSSESEDYRKALGEGMEAVEAVVKKYLKIFKNQK